MIFLAALVVLARSSAWAQAGTGGIDGTVMDGGGQPVAGTVVTARHVATDTRYRVATNDLGQYRFVALLPGTYEVTTVLPGAPGPAILTIEVKMGASTTANIDASTPLAKKKDLPGERRPVRFEVGGRVGWTMSDGVSGDGIKAADGNVYNALDPLDSLSWGLTLGWIMTPRFELEFLFDRQSTTLQASGTRTVDVSDLSIGNYHGVVSFHFLAPAAAVRPYVIGGFGGTTYGTVTFTGGDGTPREINGRNRLSSTFGGGVKVYRGQLGARVEARLTPTPVKEEATGWWCDPYWGCYVTSKSQYSKQFELSGGVTYRF